MACILLVEDNPLITEAVTGYLELEGYKTVTFNKVRGVLDVIRRGAAELVILDIMLPDGNGFSLAKSIREISDIPLLFLTAKDSESDRILGFEVGADDYVCKPFSTKELILRVQALLKRTKHAQSSDDRQLKKWKRDGSMLEIDAEKHILKVNDAEIYLTSTEWKILLYLCDYENQVISRSKILSECLNYFFEGSERTVDTHIANLRTKLGGSDWITTVRGFGYKFCGDSR
ncbi:MAG: response regulator transcription factor [Treponema sp.]|jgi:two-component system phosphate regulon response regulator PhoB|nr:response regulator transcription factor [Treponema sp.]